MSYYVKRAIPIKAIQWNENGDHPEVKPGSWKWKDVFCGGCDRAIIDHGLITTLEGTLTVCPGDFIITGVNSEHYPCKKEIFYKTHNKLVTGSVIECDHCEGKGTTSGTEPCADCNGTGEKQWEEE